MLKIRRPLGRLIFNMGIAIPGKTVFLIETAPCTFPWLYTKLASNWIQWQYVNIPAEHLLQNHFTSLTHWGRDKMDAILLLKCIFLSESVWIPIKISMKFVPKGPINNIPALVQIMAWRRPGNKPLSEPMMVSLRMHICVTRPQWVNRLSSQNQIDLSCNFLTEAWDEIESSLHHAKVC